MYKFNVSAIDPTTQLEIVLSGAGLTYNKVCYYIDNHFDVVKVHDITDSKGNTITIFDTTTRQLLYDDCRSLLLGT